MGIMVGPALSSNLDQPSVPKEALWGPGMGPLRCCRLLSDTSCLALPHLPLGGRVTSASPQPRWMPTATWWLNVRARNGAKQPGSRRCPLTAWATPWPAFPASTGQRQGAKLSGH